MNNSLSFCSGAIILRALDAYSIVTAATLQVLYVFGSEFIAQNFDAAVGFMLELMNTYLKFHTV